ncbi:hypothetical protein G9A89_015773 [Geosiphon pyriformis]|nr:hypothetical protein G9A89_015773 [Geosiphon pyriformis]
MESEKEEKKEAKDQEFTYQNPISENSDIETPNFQTHNPYQPTTNCSTTTATATTPNSITTSTTTATKLESNGLCSNIWLNNIEKVIAANRWNDARAMQVILYFLQDTTNSWYQSLQGENEAADYFTVPQILNQLIRGLYSTDLQAAIMNARDFKANHVQAVNLVMNRSSELDSKLKQFSNSINQKLEGYLANN